jgi:hypothetical protein
MRKILQQDLFIAKDNNMFSHTTHFFLFPADRSRPLAALLSTIFFALMNRPILFRHHCYPAKRNQQNRIEPRCCSFGYKTKRPRQSQRGQSNSLFSISVLQQSCGTGTAISNMFCRQGECSQRVSISVCLYVWIVHEHHCRLEVRSFFSLSTLPGKTNFPF